MERTGTACGPGARLERGVGEGLGLALQLAPRHVHELVEGHEARAVLVDLTEEIEPAAVPLRLLERVGLRARARVLEVLVVLARERRQLLLRRQRHPRRRELRPHIGRRLRLDRAHLETAECAADRAIVAAKLGRRVLGRLVELQEGVELVGEHHVGVVRVEPAPERLHPRLGPLRAQLLPNDVAHLVVPVAHAHTQCSDLSGALCTACTRIGAGCTLCVAMYASYVTWPESSSSNDLKTLCQLMLPWFFSPHSAANASRPS